MAKHAHRLMLKQKKMWKCMIPGCKFFVHMGLTDVLLGKVMSCWECGEQYEMNEESIEAAMIDDMPKCADCRNRLAGMPTDEEMGAEIEKKLALAKYGVKHESELSEEQRSMLRMLGILPKE